MEKEIVRGNNCGERTYLEGIMDGSGQYEMDKGTGHYVKEQKREWGIIGGIRAREGKDIIRGNKGRK